MPKIVYIEFSGVTYVVDAQKGRSLMQAALDNGVPGILGNCGGCCSCATCHAYVDAEYLSKLPPMTDSEKLMLSSAIDIRGNSRLTCQLEVSDELDGLVLRLPQTQGD
jgi:2Fe-2S ferredoxin